MKIQLIENWNQWYKMISMYAIIVLGLLPDIWNLAISFGLLEAAAAPKQLAYTINLVAFIGAVGRLVKQKALEQTPPVVTK